MTGPAVSLTAPLGAVDHPRLAPVRVCYRHDGDRRPMTVLARAGEWVWLDAGKAWPVTVPETWVEDITSTKETAP